MATIIILNEKNKLAILKIMIDINNHYSERLPKAFKIIQKTARFFNLSNGISVANDISISDAQRILKTAVNHHHTIHDFLTELLAYMLRSSKYGVYKKVDKLLERDDFEEYSERKEYKKYEEFLQREFQEEWNYVFNLLENIILWPATSLAGFLMFWPESPLNRNNWIVVDETQKEVTKNHKITKNKEIKATVSKQIPIKTEVQANANSKTKVNEKQFLNKNNMIAIDLGLSVMWGDRNLGSNSPERSGKIYTWTDAMKMKNGLDIAGQLLGKGWRLPTYQEIEELLSNRFKPCYSPYSFGIQVQGRNGNSIFLPASNIDLNTVSSTNGQYWSSTLDDEMSGYANQFRFDQRGVYGGSNKIDYKQSIRPVFDPYI